MKTSKTPVLIDGTHEYLLVIDDGEEWDAVTEAFKRHYPDRAGMPIDLAHYTQEEINAVMVEFEPKKKSASVAVSPANTD